MKIIGADERLAEKRGVEEPDRRARLAWARPRSAAHARSWRVTLFVDIEAGDLAVQDVPVHTVRVDDWPTARDLACRIGGPNLSFPPTACYSQAHFASVGGEFEHLDKYSTIFVDSITAISRLSFRYAEQQPEAFTPRGAKDTRSAYGLHAREMLLWLHQLQHARGKTVVFVGILEKVVDEFNRARVRAADGRGQDRS